jgi:hypothetical protein
VTQVLKETSDLRLVPGGKLARVSELDADWPSYAYQRMVHAEGVPSEAVVRLRMDAAGVELVRAAEPEMEEAAGDHRIESLDTDPSPDTAPASYEEMTPFERDVPPGDHGDIRLVNPVEDPTWPRRDAGATPKPRRTGGKSKSRARKRKGA